MVKYNEANKKQAIDLIGDFDANFGGTEIYQPIQDAFSTKVETGVQKRVFLLTDGCVSNRQGVINLIDGYCQKNVDTKVFTFGISDHCDKQLVE